jgi:hypothetical protein
MAFRRALVDGHDETEIEAAVQRWVEGSDGKTERFDVWVAGDAWQVWKPDKPVGTDWRGEVELFQRFGDWRPGGPPPGNPGCQAPQDVLEEFGYGKDAA